MSEISTLNQTEWQHRLDDLQAEHQFNEDEQMRLRGIQNLPETMWERMLEITVRQILQAREQINRPRPTLEQIERMREACRTGKMPFSVEETD